MKINPKDRALERLLKAFANARRVSIIRYLSEKKQATVGEVATHIKLSLKATSKHLLLLAQSDIVEREQASLTVLYSLGQNMSTLGRKLVDLLS